ncbi:MAG TPA: response regulator transcription factor [Acidobacteriaceae bacterium]|nr:response regulator transcription factor [Acidobacteriaceae bacterium]
MKILVIEDEKRLAHNIARSVREACGYAVDLAFDGREGLYLASEGSYDAICLDLMLPGMTGTQVLTELRARKLRTPVLILTARDETTSVVALLNQGADDYLAKPFDLDELKARLQALIRRSQGHADSLLSVGDLEMDVARAIVRRAGAAISLSPMEYRVLEYLMHRPGVVITKAKLLEHLYDFNWEKFSNVVEVYISGLRKKIDAGAGTKLIHTLRGHGYMLRHGAPE